MPVPGACAGPCATMAVSCGAELLQKVQQSFRDPSMDSTLKNPQRYPAQCPRTGWVDCRQRVWHKKWVRRSRDPAWFSHPVRPPQEFWSPTTPDILLLNVPHCPMAAGPADPTEQLVCTEIPNAVWIDLTKDCLCTPLLSLKGMIFPLGLCYSFFSIIRRISSVREMSYSIPCPFPHQRIFSSFPPASVRVCLSPFACCHSRQPSSKEHVLPC